MSRYQAKPAFDPLAAYVSTRVMTLNGEDLAPGDRISKDGIHERRLRALYDAGKIAMAPRPVVTLDLLALAKLDEETRLELLGEAGNALVEAAWADDSGAPVSIEAELDVEPQDGKGAPPPGDAPPVPSPSEPEAFEDPAQVPASRVVKAGLGGWQIINESGEVVSSIFKTKKAAEDALLGNSPLTAAKG